MNERVLITGGASGLGLALAARYLKDGARVLITDQHDDRGAAALQTLGHADRVHFLAADVRDEARWQELRAWCQETWGGLDVLINNAGVASAGRVERTTADDWQWTLDVNLLGAVRGCRTFTPLFKQQRAGHIVNVASLAAIASLPVMSAYNVSKAGLVSLSETLRFELEPHGVRVSVACPGFFKTRLGESLRTAEPELVGTVHRLLESGSATAEQVADRIVRASRRGRFLILPQREGKALWFTRRFLPVVYRRGIRDTARRLLGKVGDLP